MNPNICFFRTDYPDGLKCFTFTWNRNSWPIKVILVGDPGRVSLVASHFEEKKEIESREFKTITGTYKGKRITVVSTGIGCDNIEHRDEWTRRAG